VVPSHQPGLQPLRSVTNVRHRDANLRKSQLRSPPPHLLQQLLRIDVGLIALSFPTVDVSANAVLVHAPILRTHSLLWRDERDCEVTAQALARSRVIGNACLHLQGDLGAGKTTFARALLRALGVQGRIKSPTYALLEPYDVAGLSIAHMDLYRLDDPQAWASAGLRDVLAAPGLKLIEWPERAAPLLPTPDLTLMLSVVDETSRRVVLHAHTTAGTAMLTALSPNPASGSAAEQAS
jgi:tRNA threonylcarbamoyladenosine biosynthesis protein TsaE